MKARALLPLLLVSAISFAANVSDPVALGFKVAEGQSTTYRFDLQMGNAAFAVKVSATLTERIAKVNADQSVDFVGELRKGKMELGGDVTDASDADTKFTYNGKGSMTKMDIGTPGEDDISGMVLNLRAAASVVFPDKPVNVGESWTAAFKSPEVKGAEPESSEATNLKYTFVAQEKVAGADTAKITIVEDGPSADGTITATTWVDVATGLPIRMELKMADPENKDETLLRVTMERVAN